VKYKHLLQTELLRLGEVQMAEVEDIKHVLPYEGYMALDTRTASEFWRRKLTLKT
jgi:hypothetical protein